MFTFVRASAQKEVNQLLGKHDVVILEFKWEKGEGPRALCQLACKDYDTAVEVSRVINSDVPIDRSVQHPVVRFDGPANEAIQRFRAHLNSIDGLVQNMAEVR